MRIAFIPARCGSKSIPFKNIKEINGHPLIYWNLRALEETIEIDKIIVATDCDQIADVVRSLGFKKVEIYYRESVNANDTASTESVMVEYLKFACFDEKDVFLLVQCTSPFTQAVHFSEALSLYLSTEFDSILSVTKFKRFLWKHDATPLNYNPASRPRRQDFEGFLLENGAFYINSVGNILSDVNRLSGRVGAYVMPEYTALEIDEEDDWVIAEHLMRKYFSNTPTHR